MTTAEAVATNPNAGFAALGHKASMVTKATVSMNQANAARSSLAELLVDLAKHYCTDERTPEMLMELLSQGLAVAKMPASASPAPELASFVSVILQKLEKRDGAETKVPQALEIVRESGAGPLAVSTLSVGGVKWGEGERCTLYDWGTAWDSLLLI